MQVHFVKLMITCRFAKKYIVDTQIKVLQSNTTSLYKLAQRIIKSIFPLLVNMLRYSNLKTDMWLLRCVRDIHVKELLKLVDLVQHSFVNFVGSPISINELILHNENKNFILTLESKRQILFFVEGVFCSPSS